VRHQPRKRFGQNFLNNQYVIDSIVSVIAPRRDDVTVEIGPGLGALTQPLARALEHLHVIELDRDIVAQLRETYAGGNVIIHEGDALKFDFLSIGTQLRVVGNLPYNISTPLLFHLAAQIECVRDIHVMLQKEVVERMVAAPGTSEYGRLSVMLQYAFDMEKVLDVGPEAFYPQPKVHSAVVRMLPRVKRDPAAHDEALFAKVVMAAFSQRRKTLRNTMKNLLNANDFPTLNIDPGARAETLAVGDFVRIANRLGEQQIQKT
jgi:16S rRNA (adenine1518-N6/adenine1519-N6)-dimethyltransferase